MSKYIGHIEDAIEGLQKYIAVEEDLISLCRKVISHNEKNYKKYMDAMKDTKAENDVDYAYQDWTASTVRAEVAFDVLSILGYKVDHYFMDSPIIVAREN